MNKSLLPSETSKLPYEDLPYEWRRERKSQVQILSEVYLHRDPDLLELIQAYGEATLREMIDFLIKASISDRTKAGGVKKYLNSGYPIIRVQVAKFFRDEAHRIDDSTGAPIYRFRSKFVDAALRYCTENPINMQCASIELSNELIDSWLRQDLASEFPAHWKRRLSKKSLTRKTTTEKIAKKSSF